MTCGITVPRPRQWKPRIVTTRPPGNGLFIAFQFLGPHPLGFTNAHMMLSSWLPTNHLLSIKSNSTLFLTLQKEQHQTGLKILFFFHLGAWDTSFFRASSWFPSPAPSSPLPMANRVGGPRHPLFLSLHRLWKSQPSLWFQWPAECCYLPSLNLCAKDSEVQTSLVNAFDLSVLQATDTQIHNFSY